MACRKADVYAQSQEASGQPSRVVRGVMQVRPALLWCWVSGCGVRV